MATPKNSKDTSNSPTAKEKALIKGLETKDDVKKKLDQLKKKLDVFKTKVLSKFEEYVIGIALLPPEKPQQLPPQVPQDKKNPTDIDVLILVDDADVKKMTRFELRDKLFRIIDNIAVEVDKNIKPQVMLMTELKETCFDAKYDMLQLISLSALIHDPKDVLKALKVSEIHKSMVLKKFEKYIVSYVAVGSLFRGDARSHDIDVAVVVDDTDVKKMSRAELREKLGAIIRTMGYDASAYTQVKKTFHIQVYILTDFWESIKEAHPVIFTFLRDGIPLYDRGIFMPWKLLLNMGRIKPSPEAIDMHMDVGERLVERAKGKLISIVADDIYYATLNPSQAALMYYGVPPPTPRETIKLMDEIFVKKEKILEKKYVNFLEKAFTTFKAIEHVKLKEVKGKDVDSMLLELKDFLKRMHKLFKQIEKKTEKERIKDFYETAIHVVKDALRVENVKLTKDIRRDFKKLVDDELFTTHHLNTLKDIIKVKEQYKKMNKQEIEKIKRETSTLLRALMDHIQRKRGRELERAKIRIKYGDTHGEIYLLDTIAYLVGDIDAKEKKISTAQLLPNGGLGELKNSTLKELDEALTHANIPKKVFIKERIFEDLRKIYGKKVEILLHY